jgi:positive regulator of sigma E activity
MGQRKDVRVPRRKSGESERDVRCHENRTCEPTTVRQFPQSSQSVRVRVTLQLTVSQSVCLGVEPRPGLMSRYLFFLESFCPVNMGRPL